MDRRHPFKLTTNLKLTICREKDKPHFCNYSKRDNRSIVEDIVYEKHRNNMCYKFNSSLKKLSIFQINKCGRTYFDAKSVVDMLQLAFLI
jgi:hypothetical protein